ncbi:hypothetical protein Tco_1571380 [Tanacetum coccineum]
MLRRSFTTFQLKEKERYKADIRANQYPTLRFYQKTSLLINQYTESKDIWENWKMILGGETFYQRCFDDDVDDSTENDLALNVDHIFEADECDALAT